MKKLLYSAAVLALAFLAGSCQRENLEPVVDNGTVTYTVQVPGAIATKADDGVNNVDKLVYEVYRTSGEKVTAFSDVDNCLYHREAEVKNGKAEIDLEFVNDQNFTVLFWAYDSSTNVYNVTDLTNVTVAPTTAANTHETVAFTGVDFVINCVSEKGGDVTLTRPVAQLNIATTPESLKMDKTDITVSESYVKVYGLSTSFNVAEQDAGDATDNVTYTQAAVLGGTVKVGSKDYNNLAMNYLGFIPSGGVNVKVDYLLKTSEGDIDNTIENVPVKANYKTNIIGNLISATDNYQVTLGAWGTPDTNVEVVAVSTAQDLQEAIENIQPGAEGNIILEGNIDLSVLFGASTLSVTKTGNAVLPFNIEEGETLTLDLNGFTISTPWENESAGKHYYAFENHGTLTILDSKGTGKIVARGNFNYGKMTLESGTITACDGNGGYGVRNYEGAEFVMNGGTVATTYEDGDIPGKGTDATTLRVDEGATAIIEGGTINNICNYTFALDNHGTTTVNGGEFTSIHTTAANNGTLTINGGSFTCNGLEGITAHALWAAAGTTTINGGTFNGKDNYNGFNVDASAGAVVNITGGKFLPVHSGSLYGEGTINVTGGEFFDDPSERVAEGFIAEKNGEVWVVAKAPVAQIGEVKYYTLEEAVAAAKAGDTITVLCNVTFSESLTLPAGVTFNGNGKEIQGTINVAGDLAIMGDVTISTIKATNGGVISIEDGKVLTLNNFSFGSKANANAVYEINGGTVTANYGFFQHGTYELRSNFETGYMYYSFSSNITVYGTFHSQGRGDGLDYVRGNLTIAKGGKSIHDKTLWVGQPASWGEMKASLTIEDGGYVQANNLCVYEGSSLTYYNNADLKYNNKTFEGTITAPQQDNEIWYTATALVHAHFYKDKFGEGTDLVSNEWDETTGKGVITLSGPITKISGNAFYDRDALISISFPNSVTTIGDNNNSVFSGCPNLETVKFGRNVQFIGFQAFWGCANLKNVVLPESLTTIGESAFNSCTALKTITIPAGVTSIGDFAFNGISDLKVYCKPATPPTVGSTPFNKWWAEIYVPAASLTAYQVAWGSVCDNIYAE